MPVLLNKSLKDLINERLEQSDNAEEHHDFAKDLLKDQKFAKAQKHYEEAITFYENAVSLLISIREEYKNNDSSQKEYVKASKKLAHSYYNIALCHEGLVSIAHCYGDLKSYETTYKYYNMAKEIYKEVGAEYHLNITLEKISKINDLINLHAPQKNSVSQGKRKHSEIATDKRVSFFSRRRSRTTSTMEDNHKTVENQEKKVTNLFSIHQILNRTTEELFSSNRITLAPINLSVSDNNQDTQQSSTEYEKKHLELREMISDVIDKIKCNYNTLKELSFKTPPEPTFMSNTEILIKSPQELQRYHEELTTINNELKNSCHLIQQQIMTYELAEQIRMLEQQKHEIIARMPKNSMG